MGKLNYLVIVREFRLRLPDNSVGFSIGRESSGVSKKTFT